MREHIKNMFPLLKIRRLKHKFGYEYTAIEIKFKYHFHLKEGNF